MRANTSTTQPSQEKFTLTVQPVFDNKGHAVVGTQCARIDRRVDAGDSDYRRMARMGGRSV